MNEKIKNNQVLYWIIKTILETFDLNEYEFINQKKYNRWANFRCIFIYIANKHYSYWPTMISEKIWWSRPNVSHYKIKAEKNLWDYINLINLIEKKLWLPETKIQ